MYDLRNVEKYEALARYIENYDYENLQVLSFPKEDKTFLVEACNIKIAIENKIKELEIECEQLREEAERYKINNEIYKYRCYIRKANDIVKHIKWLKQFNFDFNNVEKYEALARYIENYDYENLQVLSFPKEDKTFLVEACNIKIAIENKARELKTEHKRLREEAEQYKNNGEKDKYHCWTGKANDVKKHIRWLEQFIDSEDDN